VNEIVSQPSTSVISPTNASYTSQSKANILGTPVMASKTNVKEEEKEKKEEEEEKEEEKKNEEEKEKEEKKKKEEEKEKKEKKKKRRSRRTRRRRFNDHICTYSTPYTDDIIYWHLMV
jgi:FtsZ-interacting cell division protein YlmF